MARLTDIPIPSQQKGPYQSLQDIKDWLVQVRETVTAFSQAVDKTQLGTSIGATNTGSPILDGGLIPVHASQASSKHPLVWDGVKPRSIRSLLATVLESLEQSQVTVSKGQSILDSQQNKLQRLGFFDLSDTPSVHSAGSYIKVNSSANGLVLSSTIIGLSTFLALQDTPSTFTGMASYLVSSPGPSPELVTFIHPEAIEPWSFHLFPALPYKAYEILPSYLLHRHVIEATRPSYVSDYYTLRLQAGAKNGSEVIIKAVPGLTGGVRGMVYLEGDTGITLEGAPITLNDAQSSVWLYYETSTLKWRIVSRA